MRRLMWCGLSVILATGTTAYGAVADKLLPERSLAMPWVVGAGILVATLIAGFKHPGRSHLD